MKAQNVMQRLIFFCAAGLILVLPIAHVSTVRAFLLVAPLLLWAYVMAKAREWRVEKTPLDKPILLFLAAILISFATTLSVKSSLNAFRSEFLSQMLLFYLVSSNFKEEWKAKALVDVLIYGSLFMAAVALVKFTANSTDFLNIGYRAGSLHQGYEAYAQYIIMVMPFNIMALLYAKGAGRKALMLSIFVLNAAALFFTFTRGAWIAFWVELFLISALALRSVPLRLAVIAMLVLVPIGLFKALPEGTLWHGNKGLELGKDSSKMNTGELRATLWKNFLTEFSKDPFTPAGYGKYNFKRKFNGPQFLGFDQAHNTFVNTAAQLGIQGFIALLVIIFVVLRTCWTAWKRASSEFPGRFSLTMFIMTVGFFTANQFAEFYIDDTALMFWLFAGLAVSMYKRVQERSAPGPVAC